jgi:hypothetical protein
MIKTGLHLGPVELLTGAISLLPTFRTLHRPDEGVQWKEMKRLLFLRTLQRALGTSALARHRVVVLDEGAVYMLARLRVLGGDRVHRPGFERYWHDALGEWSRLVDFVVWLDADDSILTERLKSRSQAHPARGLSERAIGCFMGTYREAYAYTLAAFAAGRNTEILKFRTDRESSGAIADQVLSLVRRSSG